MDSVFWIGLYLGIIFKHVASFGDNAVQYIGPSKIAEGDTFTLSCVTPVQNSSTWTLNGSVLITDENLLGYELVERKLYSFYKEMVIRSVSAQLYHTGEYRCNPNSRDYHFVQVVENAEVTTTEQVTEPPPSKQKRARGDRFPKRYSLQINVDYQFVCEADEDGYPIVWLKDMLQIDSFSHPNVELYDKYLILRRAQLEDVGEYSCRLDVAFQPGKQDVLSRFLLTSPVEIVDMSERQNVIRGRSMTIYCRAKGFPHPRITWYIGNLNALMLKEKDLRISVYSKREKVPNAYLTVRNMTRFDRGLYTCRAENGIKLESGKKYHEKSIPVYVRDNIIEPNEDEPGIGKILIPGEPLHLQCKTEECPYCSMIWFKEGRKLFPVYNVMHMDEVNNSLVIHSATANDTGLYECAVDRELLNVDLRATIEVKLCDDLLNEGVTIEGICEVPVVESSAMMNTVWVLEFLFLIPISSLLTKMGV